MCCLLFLNRFIWPLTSHDETSYTVQKHLAEILHPPRAAGRVGKMKSLVGGATWYKPPAAAPPPPQQQSSSSCKQSYTRSYGALKLMDVLQCMVIGTLRPQVLSCPRSLALTHVCAPALARAALWHGQVIIAADAFARPGSATGELGDVGSWSKAARFAFKLSCDAASLVNAPKMYSPHLTRA